MVGQLIIIDFPSLLTCVRQPLPPEIAALQLDMGAVLLKMAVLQLETSTQLPTITTRRQQPAAMPPKTASVPRKQQLCLRKQQHCTQKQQHCTQKQQQSND
eukprot:3229552-Rhodomonas_salina.2